MAKAPLPVRLAAPPLVPSSVAFLRLVWRELAAPPVVDAAFPGVRLADVPVTLGGLGDGALSVAGTLSLHRTAAGAHRLGVELPHPLFGGLRLPVRRRVYSLDDVLDVRWEPGRWGGTLRLTPMERGGLRDLPGRPRGAVSFGVGRGDRARAEAFAHAVAVADLPA
ncbi:hypothetical protein RQM47_08050 [Rubrivirga sp. S365]|uniref:hypothetical protein n=1 Tax=Rubrivirga sp. S365 TaxID=3076080 RepID=UPI0028C789A5|nr:hypothetical protein [Rubrivirga sp. S365]MDT7856589.1 hypothetical protein [Rubrivirga sp. S365]